MTTQDSLFLVVFDRAVGTADVEDLGHDSTAAMEILTTRERDVADDPNIEVVLIGSPSLETLQRTHSSYFGAATALQPTIARANGC